MRSKKPAVCILCQTSHWSYQGCDTRGVVMRAWLSELWAVKPKVEVRLPEVCVCSGVMAWFPPPHSCDTQPSRAQAEVVRHSIPDHLYGIVPQHQRGGGVMAITGPVNKDLPGASTVALTGDKWGWGGAVRADPSLVSLGHGPDCGCQWDGPGGGPDMAAPYVEPDDQVLSAPILRCAVCEGPTVEGGGELHCKDAWESSGGMA